MGVKSYTGINDPVPQTIPADSRQVENNAGGYTFTIPDLAYAKRFLILGIEGGSYYVSEKKMQYTLSADMKRIVAEKGKEVVDLIVEVSDKGLAAKNDPALFLLAVCASAEDKAVRKYALSQLWRVARIPTHLYHFMLFVKPLRGKGRLLDKALEKWFNNKKPEDLAYSLTKYEARDGFSARDVLRLAKPVPPTEAHQVVYNYITWNEKKVAKGKKYLLNEEVSEDSKKVQDYLKIVESVKSGKMTEKQLVKAIEENHLPMEVIPTDKRSAKVYDAVLKSAGMTWIVRNLGNLSKCDLLKDGNWDVVNFVCEKLVDDEQLKKSRIHPINVLAALKTYSAGKGFKGNGEWAVSQRVVKALDEAFYKSFHYVEPTNKKYYVAIDCSGSMFMEPVNGMPFLNAAEVAACFGMTVIKTEKNSLIKGFQSKTRKLFDSNIFMGTLDFGVDYSLPALLQTMKKFSWGGTDCALPILDAKENGIDVDVFVVITDNETWAGKIHTHVALKDYNKGRKIPAKVIVLGTSVSNFSVAEPGNPNMLDVAGFSSDIPQAIAEFTKM